MEKLSEKKYWDSIYEDIKSKDETKNKSLFSGIKNRIKNISRDYSNYVLSELYFKYLPKSPDLKMIEVGCAPGKYIINFHKQFGYEPYGVEYSEDGCLITKNNFLKNSLNPANVMKADFFDEVFQSANSGKYDLIFSRGFIEHFDDVSKVVDDHLRLVGEKGYLVISIPNISGLNYYILNASNRSSLITHNFSIMNKDVFCKLFENKNLDFLYCDYVGTFSFGLFNTDRKWKYYLWRIFLILQRPFDLLWRVIFGKHHIKSRYTSPYLLFIGRKK